MLNGTNYDFCDNEDDDHALQELLQEFSDEESDPENFDFEEMYEPTPKKTRIINQYVTAALDRAKVSDRMAAMIIAAVLQFAGQSLDSISFSTATVKRHRDICRDQLAEAISSHKLVGEARLVVQWDGKLMTDPDDSISKAVRLPVLVSVEKGDNLLRIPKLPNGKAETQVEVILKLLRENEYEQKIGAMCCDTTNVNTGANNGTCVRLEKELRRKLLWLACRHHIFELPLRAIFEEQMHVLTKSPEVSIFKKFREEWKNLDKSNFKSGMEDDIVARTLADKRQEILLFAHNQLRVKK